MPVEHDGQVFVNGDQLAERLALEQLLGSAFAQNVGQSPVGILDVDQELAALHPGLVLVLESFAAEVTV